MKGNSSEQNAVTLAEIKKDIGYLSQSIVAMDSKTNKRLDSIDSNVAKYSGELGRKVDVTEFTDFIARVESLYITRKEFDISLQNLEKSLSRITSILVWIGLAFAAALVTAIVRAIGLG